MNVALENIIMLNLNDLLFLYPSFAETSYGQLVFILSYIVADLFEKSISIYVKIEKILNIFKG